MKGESLKGQEQFIKDFGQNLKKLRTELGFTQESLAFKAELSVSQIQRIEYGEINTTIATVNTLAEAIGIEVEELFKL